MYFFEQVVCLLKTNSKLSLNSKPRHKSGRFFRIPGIIISKPWWATWLDIYLTHKQPNYNCPCSVATSPAAGVSHNNSPGQSIDSVIWLPTPPRCAFSPSPASGTWLRTNTFCFAGMNRVGWEQAHQKIWRRGSVWFASVLGLKRFNPAIETAFWDELRSTPWPALNCFCSLFCFFLY